ncbi:MAG: hypothetical protein EPO06_11895 [Burkholderiaceae bacterium]|nr:MAG: hypothetical protein EPO06_11895 [Burkholderiaceae bacterium]
MAGTITVDPKGARRSGAPAARRGGRELAPGRELDGQTLNTADPAGPSRREVWAWESADGLWRVDRQEMTGTPWIVKYLPTGQESGLYGNLPDARADIASGEAYGRLRWEAKQVALDLAQPEPARAHAMRWLSVYLRDAGADEPDARCECGGYLIIATRDGRMAHLDCCAECWTPGVDGLRPVDAELCRHVTCPDARPEQCAHLGCVADGRLDVAACQAGHGLGWCCGCCNPH